MNRIYKLRWCARLGAMVAVSEITTARGKHGGRASKVAAAVATALVSATAAQATPSPCGNPSSITSDTTISGALTFSGDYACHPTNNASLTVGPMGQLVATSGTEGLVINVVSLTTAGAIVNNGLISGATRGIGVAGTLSGGFLNNGVLTSARTAFDATTGANVSSFVNGVTGTITTSGRYSAVHFDGATVGSITNDGYITTSGGYGIEVKNSTVTGDILNSGTITNGLIADTSTLSGNLLNTGNITGIFGAAGATIQGQISSSGTIDGAIFGLFSNIGNGIVNDGVLVGPLATLLATVSGGIHNTGEIHSTSSSLALILIGSSVSGGVHNSGSIMGAAAGFQVVAGSIDGGITNSGTIVGGANAIQIGGHDAIVSGTGSGYHNYGVTLSGGITNSGQITANAGDGLAVIGSSLTGDIVNSGTIAAPSGNGISFAPGRTGSTGTFVRNTVVGSIINNGTITGGSGIDIRMTDIASITNEAGATISGSFDALLVGESSTVNGDVINRGLIESTGGAAVDINDSVVTGGVRNEATGTLSGMGSGARDGLRVVAGAVVNQGIINAGVIQGDSGILLSAGTVSGGINNAESGAITGIEGGISIIDSSTVSGGITNAGSIAGDSFGISVDDTATLANGITNAGTIAGGLGSLDLNNTSAAFAVDNSGTLIGDVELGINTLNLLAHARVLGNVTGSAATLNVLDDFSGEGEFDVDTFNIGSAGVFHIQQAVTVGGGGFHNEGALDVAGNTAAIFGDYSQSSAAFFRTNLSSESDYGRLQVFGNVALSDGTGIDVNVIGAPMLGNNVRLSDVITATGTLEHGNITVTDNSYLFNFVADTSRDPKAVDLLVVVAATPPPPAPEPTPTGWSQSVVTAAMENHNRPGLGAAHVLDDLIATNGGNSDLQQVISALGLLATSGQVSDALRQTLPLMTGANAMATSNALHSMNRVIQSRIESNRGLSSGDAPEGEEHLWIRPFSARAGQSNLDGVTGFKSHTTGLALGLDGIATDDWRVGGVVTYADSKVESNSGAPRQVTLVKTYELVGYASQSLDPNTDINYQVDVGYNDNGGSRQIDFAGLDRRARADYGSFATHVSAGIGRIVPMSETTAVTPSARIEYMNVKTDGYTEKDAGALYLKVDGSTYEELVLWGDMKLTHQFSPALKLIGNVAIGYDTLNDAAQTTSAFVGGGSAFTTQGIEPSPFLGRVGLGLLSTSLSNGTEWQIRYDAEARTTEYVNQTVSARWRKRF